MFLYGYLIIYLSMYQGTNVAAGDEVWDYLQSFSFASEDGGLDDQNTRDQRYSRAFIKYCVFFKDFKLFRTLLFSVFPRCQCVYTHQAAMQQNWQSSEKFQNFKEKHNN